MKARVAASIVLALGLTAGMSGCTLLTPQDTLYIKESAHGVNGTVGKIDIRNALIISNSSGTVGNLVVTFVNNEDKAHYLSIQHDSRSHQVAIMGDAVKKIGAKGATRVEFVGLNAKPGSLTDVYFSYAGVTGTQIQVPVLSSSFPGYSDYAPSR
ncbi:hypothetical protein GCM10028798_17320 [Humibacter antri]